MASHSPQRARRPPVHPSTQVGSMQNLRETSRSPSLRSRTLKAHSMPIVPTAMQIFAASNPPQQASQGQGQQGQESSPTLSINSRRSPPSGVQVQRLLPTPPHPPPDTSQERHMSPPLPAQYPSNPHYPRPINRNNAPPHFLTKFQNMDQDSWQMTEELLADIERADQQQAQAHTQPYSAGYSHNQTNSPPKDPTVERVRGIERSSPKEPERRQPAARESPKSRDRQPISPNTPSFPQLSHTPERRGSPLYQTTHASPGEHPPSGYAQYPRDSPPVVRRPTNAATTENRPPISLATQTPPLQTISTRTPDRSLPVQEELEDEPGVAHKNNTNSREIWHSPDAQAQHVDHTRSSPTPSSDLNPEGGYIDNRPYSGRSSRAGHRDNERPPVEDEELAQHRYPGRDRDHPEEEGGYTPRSPTADLPEPPPGKAYTSQGPNSRLTQFSRMKARNGSTDQLGLRSFDPSVFENDTGMLPMGSDQPTQYAEQLQSMQNPTQSQQYHHTRSYSDQQHYHPSHLHPDDMQQYDSSAYIQAYLQSPRPDAPIPPTPHSQTAAPSPSPLISGGYDRKSLPPFSPVAPVGSPYPYPFSHVRRSQPFSGHHPNRPHLPSTYDANDLSAIQQQFTKQWQIYAQNNHGNISDSTFSPSSTPFPGGPYNPWAYWHTNRTLGRLHDTTSMQSSPSHEPIALPPPPIIAKKGRPATLRRHLSNRKPPPRVESTQPRETSPEPSSSGEETAGEERFAVAEEVTWANGVLPPIVPADDSGEWIDEEGDDEDLLELEYHPSYVGNVEKRRRRWEIGWEALTQAFQALDRQTDATLVLLAAPSHSTKLYSVTSRSVRRQPAAATSITLKEVRAGFSRIATQRRNTRSQKSSLLDRFLIPSTSSGEGSDGSSESREEDLKRALEAALGSLGALGGIYEQREARWLDEMRRVSEDRERVEMLLRQVLGDSHALAHSSGRTP